MPVREMTPQEVKDWLGNGIVMPGRKPLPQSTALQSELTNQRSTNSFSTETAKVTSDIAKQVKPASREE